jgi:hypothetical protein
MRASASASRWGLGSGIQRLSWKGPLLPARNSFTQARMPSGLVMSAPIAPIPPALATAMDRLTGHAPAIGASRIGSRRPYLAQNAAARSRAREVVFGQADVVIGDSATTAGQCAARVLQERRRGPGMRR